MNCWLRLDVQGILLDFKVSNYVKTNKEDWGDSWCNVKLSLSFKDWLNYKCGASLLTAEIDNLIYGINNLLSDNTIETYEWECMEEDFKFIFSTSHLSMQWIINICDDGLTNNYLSITLFEDNLEYLLNYLRLITGEISTDSIEIRNMIQTGCLYGYID